ncbi:hypothetical protein BKA66DRAFT_415775 [Pyrenochaeta sp. MPI-SDFR-AT-0127]|nr:hypothetical protein BKA66DRAFT_415775 [Pyrenochaeta sp. MPI-SDFR-AT-0127]
MVYQYALGGTSIHLTTTDGALVARRCDLPECLCGIFSTAQGRKLAFALPMLRTCRQVYSEAIEYLYTDNSFSLSTDIDEIPTIDYFSHFFLPQRLTQIRDLFFYWELDSFNYHLMTQTPNPVLDQWYKSWGALGKLSGLRRLRVSLVFRYTHWSDYYEELWKERWVEMLEPLKTITAPRDFVVTLPDRRCSTAIDLGESHCVFELPAAVEDDDSTDDDSL